MTLLSPQQLSGKLLPSEMLNNDNEKRRSEHLTGLLNNDDEDGVKFPLISSRGSFSQQGPVSFSSLHFVCVCVFIVVVIYNPVYYLWVYLKALTVHCSTVL